jgi:hypothetical protein
MNREQDFFTSGEGPSPDHRDQKDFEPPAREANCRAAIYADVRREGTVFVRDMELKYVGKYKSSTIYRAARNLVRSGLVRRQDIQRNGKICVRLENIDPWGNNPKGKDLYPTRW